MEKQHISYMIQNTLENDSVLKIAFQRNLISPGTLAKHIVKLNPQEGLNEETVRTSIRRMRRKSKRDDTNIIKSAQEVLARSSLHVRSNIVKIEFNKNEATLNLINKTFKINEINNNNLFRLIKGHSVFHAIAEETNFEKIKEIFSGNIIGLQKDLCEFIVIMPEMSKQTPGILLTLINELSLNSINIVQAFSCGEEINVIVDDKENQKAYNLLTDLFKRCKMENKA